MRCHVCGTERPDEEMQQAGPRWQPIPYRFVCRDPQACWEAFSQTFEIAEEPKP